MRHSWLLIPLLTAVTGCAELHSATEPFLPLLAPPAPGEDEIFMLSSGSGIPVVDRGCVRIKSTHSRRMGTVLWHQGTELGNDTNGCFLRNVRTGSVYRFGQVISFGGGEMPTEWAASQYPEVARRCGPPYSTGWLPK